MPENEKIKIKINIYGLVNLFNVISPFVGYLMQKPPLKKNSSGTV